MKTKVLLASLALLGGFSTVSLPTFAADAPAQTVRSPVPDTRELKVGDMAPDKLQRKDAAVSEWKKHGLKAPVKDSQWVKIDKKYVLIKITNGQIVDIVPAKK